MYDILTLSSDSMTLSEKLAQLQEIAHVDTQTQFADLLGVNTATLRRMADRGGATDHVLGRVASAFEGISVDTLRDDNLPLPDGVCLSGPSRRVVDHQSDTTHEGANLKRYLARHDIRQTELADQLKVSRPQVHSYLKTERFRAEVRRSIAAALGQPEEVIFGTRVLVHAASMPNISLLGLPLLRPADRQTGPDELLAYQRDFAPLTHPDRVFYINPAVLRETPDALADALAIEVTDRDHMDPALRPGAIVLAVRVAPERWERITEGSVAVLVDNQLRVRRIYRNELRTSDTLEVGGADASRGGNTTLRRADLQALFQVSYILLSPA